MTNSRAMALAIALFMLCSMLGMNLAAAEETTTISLCFWELTEFDDEMSRKIEEDLNIKITVMPMTWDNEIEMKLLWAASDSLPDIISTYTVDEDIARFYSWLDSGLTRSIPEAMLEKYPSVKKIVDENDIVQAVKEYTDSISFIPRPFSLEGTFKFDQGCGFFYRKDWLANVGLQAPKTLDEFYEMLYRFTYNDPDGNGREDTYGMVLNGRVPGAIFSWWGVNTESWEFDEADGMFKPGYLTDKVLAPLEFLNKCYNDGLIDPEYTTNSNSTSQQKFAQGTFGVFYKNVDDLSIYNVLMKQFAPAQGITSVQEVVDMVRVLGPMTLHEGEEASWPAIADTSGSEISGKVSDEKLDKILQLYEYLLQPEIQTMLRYGFEGREYTVVDGQVIPEVNPNTGLPYEITSIYPSSRIYALVSWGIDTDINSNALPQEIKDLALEVREEFNPIAKQSNLAIAVMSTPAKDSTSIDLKSAFNNLVTTAGDVKAEFAQWQQEVAVKGMEEAVAEVNAKALEMGLK